VKRANVVRAALAIVVLVVSGWLVAARPARLGLDLRGGTQIVLQTRDGERTRATAKTTDEALEILRRRVDELGLAEPSLTRSGDRRIIVELPGVGDPRQAVDVIGRTAQLTFRPVLEVPTASTGDGILPDEKGRPIRLGPAAVSGTQVGGAEARPGRLAGWEVDVEFRDQGVREWATLTGTAACAAVGDPRRRVAIVLDDKVILSPEVQSTAQCDVGYTTGNTTITGKFSMAEAKELALLIRGGALPVPVEVIEQRIVGPTLGQQAIDASTRAAIIGVAATMLFIIAVYRLVGGLAALALTAYGLISYATLLALGATLTLPGLAGFVLAIGMAVDANVLVFERAREEYSGNLLRAIRGGFRGAWSAIVDSNVTTLLAAGLLFFLASGPVRGFGVTLVLAMAHDVVILVGAFAWLGKPVDGVFLARC